MINTDQESSLTFEQAYQKLEQIVQKLDSEQTTLEQSFQLFEEGQKLLKLCQTLLDQAEKRLKIITVTDEGFAVREEQIE